MLWGEVKELYYLSHLTQEPHTEIWVTLFSYHIERNIFFMQGKFHMGLWDYVLDFYWINYITGNFHVKNKMFLPSLQQENDNVI